MTLHLVALPHTRVTPEFCGCAYTAKALKFTKMMAGLDDVVLYAPEGSTDEFTVETVSCLSDAERLATFGPDDPARLPSWPTLEQTASFNRNVAGELATRYATGDLVLLTAGSTFASIVEQLPTALYCEPGVGYEGILTGLCAFESHAWRHYVYGKQGIADGRWFDTVLPNYFDLDDFPIVRETVGEYLLFLGRVVPRKGPQIALEVAEAAGLPLVVAGAGVSSSSEGLIETAAGFDYLRLEGNVSYVGTVGVAERARLLAEARALIAPTTYIEPFGGVAVEAMLAGTPAITSDWGAFTETVEEGVTGYRFRTLSEAVAAVESSRALNPLEVRACAVSRYSLEAVGPCFDEWFDLLRTLHAGGWYEMSSRRARIGA